MVGMKPKPGTTRPMTAEERTRPPTAAREARLRALVAKKHPPTSTTAAATVGFNDLPTVGFDITDYAPNYPDEKAATAAAVAASKAAQEHAEEIATILDEMRVALKKRTADVDGFSGIQGLGRNFRINDRDRSGALDVEEFTKCVTHCKLGVSPEKVAKLHAHFDRDSSGAISYDEFLHAVRGRLSPTRRKLVVAAFHALDAAGDGNGVLTTADLEGKFDASRHPDVVAGRMDAKTALRGFLDTFEGAGGNRDGVVTLSEFLKYYEEVSASIDHDDAFALLMANSWRALKAPGTTSTPAVTFVPQQDIDKLEKLLFEASYIRKGGSHSAQQRLLNDAFKTFDTNGSGMIEPAEFLSALERFGLHVVNKGRVGIGGLPEATVLALFDRYDKDGSGALSFREFTDGFLKRHQTTSQPLPAEEYNRPASANGTQPLSHSENALRRPLKKHDPELMGARPRAVGGGYLASAARIHGTSGGGGRKAVSGSAFR